MSCPNCRFQSEKIKPLWHGKKEGCPIHYSVKAAMFFGSPEHLKFLRYEVLSPQQLNKTIKNCKNMATEAGLIQIFGTCTVYFIGFCYVFMLFFAVFSIFCNSWYKKKKKSCFCEIV